MQRLTRRTVTKGALAGGFSLAIGAGFPASAPQSHPPVSQTYLDVTSFGAKGDGQTDDTKAIQAALDTVAEINGLPQPVSVFVPPGVYCSQQLRMHSNTSLIGIPAYDYERPGGSQIKLIDPNASCLIDISGTRGVTIQGLSLNGNKLGSGVHRISRIDPDPGNNPNAVENASRIEACQVAQFSGDGVHMLHGWAWTIRHSMIAYNGGHGVNCVGWDGFIHDCWLSANGGCGLVAHGPDNYTSAVTITGNRIEWNHREGILITNGSSFMQITGNFFDRNYFSGLAVTRGDTPSPCSQITITGNFFYRSGKSAPPDSPESSHLRLEGDRGITCVGNAFRAGNDSGSDAPPCTPSCGILYKDLDNCVIANNVLHQGALKTLIYGAAGNGVIVKDNPGSLLIV